MANSSLSPNLNAPPLPPRYPGIAKALAHHFARRAIERQLPCADPNHDKGEVRVMAEASVLPLACSV